jgi:hypothetical protein
MLTAMQQALQAQMNERKEEEVQKMQVMTQVKANSFQPLLHPYPSLYASSQLDTMLDEESTEADELGAFASLLSGVPSEGESVDAVEPKSPETGVSAPLTPRQISGEDSQQTSDNEKSTMVCRHWKSKGWCRLETNCKFLHPEHKRGVGAHKSSGDGCTNGGGISRAVCLGMSTIPSQLDADGMEVEAPPAPIARRKRRGGRGRSGTGQHPQLGQEVTGDDFQIAGVTDTLNAFPPLYSVVF